MKKKSLAIATIFCVGALILTSCKKPSGCTDDSILVTNFDPTAEEEELLDTELTLLYSTDGAFCGVLKPGGIPVEDQVYRECMKQSRARTSQVLKLVNAAAAQSAQ